MRAMAQMLGVVLIALVSTFTPTTVYVSLTARAANSTAQAMTSVTFKVDPESTAGGVATGIITWTAPANISNFLTF